MSDYSLVYVNRRRATYNRTRVVILVNLNFGDFARLLGVVLLDGLPVHAESNFEKIGADEPDV